MARADVTAGDGTPARGKLVKPALVGAVEPPSPELYAHADLGQTQCQLAHDPNVIELKPSPADTA